VVKRAKSDDALVVHGLSTEQVRALAGDLKPSTLEYWVNKGLVAPTARGSRGHRYERYWTIQDALLVLMIKALRDAGCPLQRITAAKQLIEERWDEEWRSSVLTWDGGELFSIGPWGDVRATWKRPGQLAMHALAVPIATWRLEVERNAVAIDRAV
jgi:DNA-binding transcriptional MerR regulator